MGTITFDDKIHYYEQMYFAHDEPVPFKGDLKIYPATVKDYYNFFSLVSCYTVDKIADPNPECISMSDLDYVFYLMQQEGIKGESFKNQFFSLLEMTFHVKNGMFCPNKDCDFNDILSFEEIYKDLAKIQQEAKETENPAQTFEKKRLEYLDELKVCPKCGKPRRDYICILKREKGNFFDLYIGSDPIKRQEYVDFKRIYCYQNILDYNDDYIDPELKEALDEANRLRAGNTSQPSLERQEACIIASTAYKFEDLKNMTIRKFSLLLRVVEAKLQYQIAKTAEASGLVTFKGEIDHWIYTNNDIRKNRFKNIMSVDQVESKIGSAAK